MTEGLAKPWVDLGDMEITVPEDSTQRLTTDLLLSGDVLNKTWKMNSRELQGHSRVMPRFAEHLQVHMSHGVSVEVQVLRFQFPIAYCPISGQSRPQETTYHRGLHDSAIMTEFASLSDSATVQVQQYR